MCSKYIKALSEIRLDAKEELEGQTLEGPLQENKIAGIWAKRKLKTEQQIAPKQSPLQRARRIRNKRQEEINRTHNSIANRGTEHKSCEKSLSNCHSERGLEIRWVQCSVALPEEDISRSSEISLPKLPGMHVRRKLPTLSRSTPTGPMSRNNKSPSLPTISKQLPTEVFYVRSQSLTHLKLPPLKL